MQSANTKESLHRLQSEHVQSYQLNFKNLTERNQNFSHLQKVNEQKCTEISIEGNQPSVSFPCHYMMTARPDKEN